MAVTFEVPGVSETELFTQVDLNLALLEVSKILFVGVEVGSGREPGQIA